MQSPFTTSERSFWHILWKQFRQHRLGFFALWILALFILIAIFAPFLASSKPFMVYYDGQWYFPLFRYLIFRGYYSKQLDLFFNLLIFTLPLLILLLTLSRLLFPSQLNHILRKGFALFFLFLQLTLFTYFSYGFSQDPAANPQLNQQRQKAIQKEFKEGKTPLPNWNFDLHYMTAYSKLNLILRYQNLKEQHQALLKYSKRYGEAKKQLWLEAELRNKKSSFFIQNSSQKNSVEKLPSDSELKQTILSQLTQDQLANITFLPTLWQMEYRQQQDEITRLKNILLEKKSEVVQAELNYLLEKEQWLEVESQKISSKWMPFFRPFHWEDDAGGEQTLNKYLNFWALTRINQKDLMAALIFGTRVSLTVGIASALLAVLIGIPIGTFAGFYGGKFDIIVSRFLEIWESMPTFFMLLLIVAMTQSKSIFLVITIIGIFGWTTFSRFIRGEFFKQRNLSYVEACHAQGFNDTHIMFSHILPNAIPPLLTLLPFFIMGAVTSEAGLSFLGLGEEGSCSWGILMDEGRSVFPGESYLLWPPALLLTIFLVAIALIGDALRDALDPKMHR